jgi:alkaline phosphatase
MGGGPRQGYRRRALARRNDRKGDRHSSSGQGWILPDDRAGNAARALYDTQALSKAVEVALSKTNAKDTLVVVTADHGHTMSIQGYAQRGTNILGLSTSILGGEGADSKDGFALALDKKPYSTLAYANGPGSVFASKLKGGARHVPHAEEVEDISYRQQSVVPMSSETHGGQDVTIYASGPRAYLFGGIVEQNYIYHVIDDALGLSSRAAKASAKLRDSALRHTALPTIVVVAAARMMI